MADYERSDQIIVVDDSIVLKQRSLDSEAAVYQLIRANLTHLSRWVFWANESYTIDKLHQDIEDYIKENNNGRTYLFDIYVHGELAGTVDAANIVAGVSAELGYWVAEKFTHRGLATRCVPILIDFIRSVFKVRQFCLMIIEDNLASIRVAEKLGFRFSERIFNSDYAVWEKRYVRNYEG